MEVIEIGSALTSPSNPTFDSLLRDTNCRNTPTIIRRFACGHVFQLLRLLSNAIFGNDLLDVG